MQRIFSCGFYWLAPWLSDGGKLRSSLAALKRWALAVALLVPISACTPLSAETDTELSSTPEESLTGDPKTTEADKSQDKAEEKHAFWPWQSGEGAKPPPVQPYKIPTLSGDQLNFKDKPAALVKAPAIDAEAVYDYVLACYPEKSKWNLDVNLRAQLANNTGDIFSSDDSGSTELGESYVAIVANMPLYSMTELNREREREHMRRQDVAGMVSDFIAAMASRNHAVRELALYRSLEARAALRVQQGIVDSAEQVKYLEKVAASHEALIKQEAKIMEKRLKLAGMCDPVNAKTINTWLKTVSAVPKRETPSPLSLKGRGAKE